MCETRGARASSEVASHDGALLAWNKVLLGIHLPRLLRLGLLCHRLAAQRRVAVLWSSVPSAGRTPEPLLSRAGTWTCCPELSSRAA